MKNEILEDGMCECILSPINAENNLEGYNKGDQHRYQKMSRDKNGEPYYRIYSVPDDNDYYETMGPNIFKKYFVVI